MAEMIGGILGAGAGLVGAGLQAQAQQTANIINWMNLQFQKQNAAKQMRFQQAARGDAYGNKQSYDDILNEWKIALTPTQNKIIKAGEAEQLRSLTEDAARNRAIKRQQRERGIEAGKDYNRVLADYRYGGPKSELAIRDELTNLLAGVEQEQSGKQKSLMMRAAMREGRGGDVASIIKGFDDSSGETLASRMLQARQQAGAEHASRTQQHMQRTLPLMSELQKLMDMGGDMPLRMSDTPDKLMMMQQQQAAGIGSAMQNEATNVGGAFANLAKSSGQSPDFSSIAKSLSGMGGGGKQGRQQQQSQAYDNYQQPDPVYSVMQPTYSGSEDRWTNSYGDF
jgi:hypothetical protein